MRAIASGILWILLFLIVCFNGVIDANGTATSSLGKGTMVPLGETKTMMYLNESRRKLNSFEICSLCTCCAGGGSYCLPSPCCYAINCNIPNRPFGFCSFTPKTCNCFDCHI